MTNDRFYKLMAETFDSALKIAKSKGQDYTVGNPDALWNFKEAGRDIELSPEKALYIGMNKHYKAIVNYIKTGGQSESEPIDERIKDCINYLVLLRGLIVEKRESNPHGPIVLGKNLAGTERIIIQGGNITTNEDFKVPDHPEKDKFRDK